MKRKGFSLIEILVCIAVLIAASALTMVYASQFLGFGKFSAQRNDISAISQAISQYHFEVGEYPTTLSDLQNKVDNFGPWLQSGTEILKDQWGKNYRYETDQTCFAVWSTGPDGNSNSTLTAISGDDIGVTGK